MKHDGQTKEKSGECVRKLRQREREAQTDRHDRDKRIKTERQRKTEIERQTERKME